MSRLLITTRTDLAMQPTQSTPRSPIVTITTGDWLTTPPRVRDVCTEALDRVKQLEAKLDRARVALARLEQIQAGEDRIDRIHNAIGAIALWLVVTMIVGLVAACLVFAWRKALA